MMKRHFKGFYGTAITAAAFLLFTGIFSQTALVSSFAAEETLPSAVIENNFEYETVDETNAIGISISQDGITVSTKDGNIETEAAEDMGISFDNGTLSIEKEGTYILSGNLEGNIEVSSSKKEQVNLILNGLSIHSEDGPAVSVKKTGTLVISLTEGTENELTSGTACEINGESADVSEEESGGALYSKALTFITGKGSLSVNGYIHNGIHVTKCLILESGNINVSAVNNGVKVKDTFVLNGADLTVLSGNDAVKAEQEAQQAMEEVIDETTGEVLQEAQDEEEASGYILINDGTLTADSYGDAVQAYLAVEINGGTLNLKTEGEYPEKGESRGGGPEGGSRGGQGRPEGQNRPDFDLQSQDDDTSTKGIKSDGTITINSGDIIIDSTDDAVHCAGLLTVNDGNLTLTTGDDGIHSDKEIKINGGRIDILDSYEGIEANQITVTAGEVSVVSSDDGFNANGGPQSFGGPGGGRNQQADTASDTPNLNIEGGTIYVNAQGDGLDSNGNITVSGGYTVVDGPENNGNGEVVTSLLGSVEMSHVSFRYIKDGPLVIDDLSLKINQGEYVAIVGPSGCGKSTLMRLLLGFEKPDSGGIFYDGKSLDKIDLPSLRRKIGTVMQNGGLFNDSIFANIAICAPELTMQEAWDAAEIACIADDIREMPMGMHTMISEGQGGISGGQKQRLMIARAIAPRPAILYFDEATSALDNIAQKKVINALDGLHCTRVVIAHRLSTIRSCNRILYIDGGRIREEGTYEELMAKNGLFADMVARQQTE